MADFSSKAKKLVSAIFLLFFLNLIILLIVRHVAGQEIRSSYFYPEYLARRSLFLRPFSILILLMVVTYGLHWVLKPRTSPVNELQRLLVLAFSLAVLFGLLLAILVPL